MAVGSWESSALTALLQQVRRTIRRHVLCPPGSRLLVAVSGGSDSVALTLVLQEIAGAMDVSIASLAHLNHRLRPAAAGDEQFCRDFAARAGLPIVIDAVDVQAYAAGERLSLEEAARRARYAFLHEVARDCGADRIAVGHTRDDQAETFLLKLIRGAGLAGLGGIYPQRGVVIRPLLDVSRTDLRGYLAGRGETWVEDESNEWLGTPRNRIRHRVLPELNSAYSGATRSIARTAATAREDGQWLDGLGQARFEELARTVIGGPAEAGLHEGGIALDAAALRADPLPVRRRVVRNAVQSLAAEREVGMEHVEAALDVLEGRCAGADIPGCRVELRRGKLVLVK